MNRVTSYDMEQINSYSAKELSSDDVYVFVIQLCDNDVDKDNERFPVESLFILKQLYVGKTGIIDHTYPNCKNTTMRILSCEVDYVSDKVTSVGEPYYRLLARAYIVKNEYTNEVIEKIESGKIHNVSIGCSVRRSVCSICHNDINSSLCDHLKGRQYNNKLCFVELTDPVEAYEFAFVVEPKPKKGITNYEKILSDMSVSKFATMMSNNNMCMQRSFDGCVKYMQQYSRSRCCYWCWLDWLNQEVEDS